MLIDIK